MNSVRFGFLQEPAEFTWSAGQVQPLADHTRIVKKILAHPQAYGGWLYPPLGPVMRDFKERKEVPQVRKEFTLPATHALLLNGSAHTDECVDFFITLFGMLTGRRLQRDGWQHFYKAPLGRKLCDFDPFDHQIVEAMERATQFWLRNPDQNTRKLAFGALHWHLFAQLYEHEFERFNAQYMALDACWKLAQQTWQGFPTNNIPHAKRAETLCTQLGVPAPSWVIAQPGETSCALVTRRNALVHEAMYGDHPIGFVPSEDHGSMELGLVRLVARILLSLLGMDNSYTRSECTTRQIFNFDF
ncbi:MAG: hypothetical protein C4575_06585 [Desulforudis sp.]|nr:MAG: hypothetical protein C4575_06585 [Desulforudis sp.]